METSMSDEMKRVIAQSVANLRVALMSMTPEERVELIAQVVAGYCEHCGDSIGESICYCRRDD